MICDSNFFNVCRSDIFLRVAFGVCAWHYWVDSSFSHKNISTWNNLHWIVPCTWWLSKPQSIRFNDPSSRPCSDYMVNFRCLAFYIFSTLQQQIFDNFWWIHCALLSDSLGVSSNCNGTNRFSTHVNSTPLIFKGVTWILPYLPGKVPIYGPIQSFLIVHLNYYHFTNFEFPLFVCFGPFENRF